MGSKSVGAYLQSLREARQWSRQVLAKKLGTNKNQIERIEYGESDVRTSFMLQLVQTVGGKLEHIAYLMLTEGTDERDGRDLAYGHLHQAERPILDQMNFYHEAGLARLLEIALELRANRRRLEDLVRYGEQLLNPTEE